MRIDLEWTQHRLKRWDRLAEMKNVSREELILEAIGRFLEG